MSITDSLETGVTVVSNEFIDNYMALANGEYVKVYLYILRHPEVSLTVEKIADALNHTDADVRRALSYWEKAGVLRFNGSEPDRDEEPLKEAEKAARDPVARKQTDPARIESLSEDEDFSQLLYIAQKYMDKIFSPREVEVFAYLYDGLSMNAELLEYLVEYCVQGGHKSIRYIETVGLSWKERGLITPEEAKAATESFSKDMHAVMKAFGLTERRPGQQEKEFIDRWYKEYGFDRDVVVEACNRTMNATHEPSFPYADKILSEWKEAGVHTLKDVALIDEKRKKKSGGRRGSGKKGNSFQNFDQPETDYDSIMMQQVKSRMQK